jgi:hypothetical protein
MKIVLDTNVFISGIFLLDSNYNPESMPPGGFHAAVNMSRSRSASYLSSWYGCPVFGASRKMTSKL